MAGKDQQGIKEPASLRQLLTVLLQDNKVQSSNS